ncbi:alpha/beta fold hydrolase [Nonomuraea endophytica]|uniref:Pimeloyl-ACP methyl ester carboxylesterase n=1 Tax=Nonomuraea endophytica TaxID=714136 RepID=A0A7W8EN10_9ACTN|nr:alpha/beta hydrolase [Nonomuraea endophytica]MBB5085241.1 pimeloyl-ACP methyl ester carboxylesterase [Nonomuraea endophytica]
MEIRNIHANGVEFAYLALGDGPLALCMHGFPDTAHTWRHLMPELAERGYRAVAPFMRGYAPTEVTEGYELGALVADANALHEELGGDENAVIIGHDWGTYPVYGTTERFRKSVVLAVPPTKWLLGTFFTYEQLKRSFYIFLFQTALAETAAAAPGFLDGLWKDWSPGYDATEDLAFLKQSLGEPANLAAAIGYYRAMLGTTPPSGRYATEQAAATDGPVRPVLYLHGAQDGCLGADLVADVASVLPEGSRAEIVEGAGHFLHLEKPREVNALILDWLG